MDKLPEAEKLGLRLPATLQAKPLEDGWTELMLPTAVPEYWPACAARASSPSRASGARRRRGCS